MALFHWFSKAEEGEKIQPDDTQPEFEYSEEGMEDDPYPPLQGVVETESVAGCRSCVQRGGVCPFHAEIPRLR